MGNGFDLAHGMKTSYHDFILSFTKSCFEHAARKSSFDDDLYSIRNQNRAPPFDFSKYTLKDFLLLSGRDEPGAIKTYSPFSWDFKSKFLLKIVDNICEYNWVDIENEYFKALKDILPIRNIKDKNSQLLILNDSFRALTDELNKYIQAQMAEKISDEYRKIFDEPIQARDVSSIDVTTKAPIKTLILDFNYTDTIKQYLKNNSYATKLSDTFEHIHIHGEAGSKTNPIVFGFGDETAPEYYEILNEESKGFLTHMKTCAYSETANYHKLEKFIRDGRYQVYILGHSCGQSDNVMLKMMFENLNCASIKIFYHKYERKDNFRTLFEEIMRRISNNGLVRTLVVNKTYCDPMPQVN